MLATISDGPDPAPTPVQPVTVDWRPIALVVVVGVAALIVGRFTSRVVDIVGLTLSAAALALITLPLQRRLSQWIGRAGATVVTALASLAGILTVAYLALADLNRQAERLAGLLRDRIDEARPGSFIDRTFTALDLDAAIDAWLSRVPTVMVAGDSGSSQIGRQIVTLLAIVILAAFLQSSGPSIVDWFVSRWPREFPDAAAERSDGDGAEDTTPRRSLRALLDDVDRRGLGTIRRGLVLAAGVATVVALELSVAGLPGAVVVGLWCGAWAIIPTVGPVVAALPVGVLIALDPRPKTAIAAIVVVAVLAVAAYLRMRFVDPTMRMGAAPHVLAVGTGIAIAGFGGSLVLLIATAAAAAALTSSHRPGRPSPWVVQRGVRVGPVLIPDGWRGALVVAGGVVGGVLLWSVLHRAAPAIAWVMIGGFIAVALSRPANFVARRTRLRHRGAAGLVLAVFATILVAVVVTGSQDGARTTTTLTEQLPAVVSDLEDAPVIGGWLQDREASVWVSDQMNDLPQRLRRAEPDQWLLALGQRLVDLFWTVVVAVTFLLEGPSLVKSLERRVPARSRRQVHRLVDATGVALTGYAAGAALVAGINASVVFTLAIVLGIGLAPVLAVWAFLWNFVPQIGGFMGGVPLVLFGLVAGPMQGLAAGVLYVVYQFIENHLIQPAVIGAAIDVAPWGTLLAALAGGAAAGLLGAVVITPLVGVVRVVRNELRSADFPGATTQATAATAVAVDRPSG